LVWNLTYFLMNGIKATIRQ